MKRLLITGAFCGVGWMGLRAQSVVEMAEQLVELQALEKGVQQGYKIVTSGLGTIGDIQNGEYGLHSAYFGSLDSVKPALAADPRVRELEEMLDALIGRIESEINYWRKQLVL